MDKLVSAIITTYNRDVKIVERALKSIINQEYKNIEIIIVNDCPENKELSNKIGEMILRYKGTREIQYIIVEKNGGACKARNIGSSHANGEYLAFLDDDDEWNKDKIFSQVKAIKKDNAIGIVYCNAEILNVEKNEKKVIYKDLCPSGDIFSNMLKKNIIGSCSFPLIRKSTFNEVGGFKEDIPFLQDWELYLRILKNYQAAYVNKTLALYYSYCGERISTHPEKRIAAYEIIHSEFKDDIENNKKIASAFYLMGTYFYSMAQNNIMAFKYYLKGIVNDPFNIRRNVKDFIRFIGRRFVINKNV